MIRIGFVGVPCSGKTTLSRIISSLCYSRLLKRSYLVEEYAREFIATYGQVNSVMDQYRILQGQLRYEAQTPEYVDIMFTDSPIFLGLLYALDVRNVFDKKDAFCLSDIFREMLLLNVPPRYDLIFWLPPTLMINDKDEDRKKQHYDEVWRKQKNDMIGLLLEIFPPKVCVNVKSISLEDRIKECFSEIDKIL